MHSHDDNIPVTDCPVSVSQFSLDESSSSPDSKFSDSIGNHEEQAMGEFSVFLEKLTPFIDEMNDKKEIMNSEAMHKAINSMEAEYYRAKAAINSPNFRSSPANQIEDMTQNLGRSLGLVLFASYEVPFDNKDKLDALYKAMMNSKRIDPESSESDYAESEEAISEYSISEEPISEEVDDIVLDKRDLVFMLSSGNDNEFSCAVSDLMFLIGDNKITDDALDKESIISILCDRLKAAKSNHRLSIIQLLRSLVNLDKSKEKLADGGFLSVLVKSLARDKAERREAVGLLSLLSEIPDVRKRIGRIQGCIVMLVSILESGDEVALLDAAKLLDSLSRNPQYALNMAEAGYFNPLIHHLKEGSDMHKMLMAVALSRMELTDKSKASLGEEGAIELLVNMFINGNFEAKLSALNSLKKTSSLKENIQRLINCGFVAPLLQLLFSVTSVLMSLREPASEILALIAQSESILVKQDVVVQMLSLLSLTSPLIQGHLLKALNSITNHASAGKVINKLREKGAIQLLLPFIRNRDSEIVIAALELMYKLSKDKQDDLMQILGETNLNIIANIVTTSESINTKVAAIGLLSNLPANDKKSTVILKQANILPVLILSLNPTSVISTCTSPPELEEGISGIIIRFTIPCDKNLQRYSVEQGLFPALMKLLCNGSALAKKRAAICLAQLSQNSMSPTDNTRKSKWFCLKHSNDSLCEVHDQNCSISTTFCLVKANVVPYLIKILETDEKDVHEEALGCLATLLNDKIVENGSNFIAKNSGIIPIIKVLHLESGSIKTKEKCIWILERIFSVEKHRVQYGNYAQMILLELEHYGDAILRPKLAKVLAQLELLQVQSSYF